MNRSALDLTRDTAQQRNAPRLTKMNMYQHTIHFRIGSVCIFNVILMFVVRSIQYPQRIRLLWKQQQAFHRFLSASCEKPCFVSPGTLYPSFSQVLSRHLVSTPIGCLSDISDRALTVLKESDVVLCEDTRTTAFLLSRFHFR